MKPFDETQDPVACQESGARKQDVLDILQHADCDDPRMVAERVVADMRSLLYDHLDSLS